MINILANDGISQAGIDDLTAKGFNIVTEHVAQEDLINTINAENYEVLLVRSATTVRKDLIDACPDLKIIGRGGVGMDNIDVDYARKKGINVINTPAASSASVAELVFAHLFSMTRFLSDSNRKMPLVGDTEFKGLKKSYANGQELAGQNLGIIGFGRIGKEVAKRAIGLGMNVIAHDTSIEEANITLNFFNGDKKSFTIETESLETVLSKSDFVTLHIPKIGDKAVIGAKEIGMMKTGAGIVNVARGGVIDETALMFALDKGKLAYAGLDVFEGEPELHNDYKVLNNVFHLPHIGSATRETRNAMGFLALDNLDAFFSGNEPANRIA